MAVILIVEDDVFIREIAEMMIQDWGHQTLAASDVDEALTFLRSPQHIDALFTDIYLKELGPRRVRSGASGHRAAAEFARALHDRQYRHRQDEGAADRRHALPAQAVHATSAARLGQRHARDVIEITGDDGYG